MAAEPDEQLIEDLAAELWEQGADRAPWADAGDYWQRPYRDLARAALLFLTARGWTPGNSPTDVGSPL